MHKIDFICMSIAWYVVGSIKKIVKWEILWKQCNIVKCMLWLSVFCLKNFLFLAVFENFQSFTKVIEIFFECFQFFFLKKKWLFVITFTQGFYVIYFCYLSATSEMPHFKST